MLPVIAEMWAKNHIDEYVQGHGDFHRDSTGAIINHDKSSFEAYKKQKELAYKSINNDTEIQHLKQEVAEIKGLLKELISKL